MGKKISRIVVDEQDFETGVRGAGLNEGVIALMLGYYRAARVGEFVTVNPTLSRILGRAPETMSRFLQANLR